MRNVRSWVAAALAAWSLVPAEAQRYQEAVEVTLVEVPVTVVDRSGNPVRGLTKADFELFDNGRKVEVEYFEMLDMTKISAEAGEGSPVPPVATRHFLLMFDLANSAPGTIERGADAARQFVASQLGARDLAAVAIYTAESGAKMLTSFTRDRALLTNAISTLGNPKYFKVADPLRLSATMSAGGETSGPAGRTGSGGSLDAAFAEMAAEHNRTAQKNHDTEMKNRLRIQLTNLASVARVLDRLPGQKQVILLSEGFDAKLVQGRENIGFEDMQEEADAIMSGEVWKSDSEQRFGSGQSSREINEMAELFRRSDVVLHAIDVKGLRSAVDARDGARSSSNEGLFLLASPTGGTVFKNANDLGENFTKMLRQQEVVYLLGFNATGSGKPGEFHDLDVRTKGRGLRVVHRSGYYEPNARASELETTLTLADIFMIDAPINDIEVSVTPVPLPGPGGLARVPVVVEIRGSKLFEDVAGDTATADLYLYAFDRDHQVADHLQQRITLDLKKTRDAVRGSGVRYFGTLHLPAGTHAVKALVRVEESGRVGYTRQSLDVPSFENAAVLQPVFFTDPATWVSLVGPSRGDDYAYPFAAGESTWIPRGTADLTAGQEYTVALFLYRIPLENLKVDPSVVTAGGASVPANVRLLGRTAPDEGGSVKLIFNFRPDGLAPGEHSLQFTVRQSEGASSVVRLPFRML